ncbi:amidohydrolase family protein [Cellulomonas sp. DKR-3]|uniref:Amidohydrolase family protein n=1 Tax=Cellulomonas fulva TaxID=2835530 RepID=A0ABS5TX54_9CELL|nr:amidohydrolase family protein [Cellulomonas fulva]MBT0993710.1 amidohydrolase family protein [Cellulomonas fulva]
MILRSARRLREPGLVDVRVDDGRIVAVAPAGSVPTDDPQGELDLAGRVLLPGFVESHLHLDKAWLGGPPGGAGLAEAIAWTARRKAQFTVADVAERAGRVAELAVAHGTTSVRAHTEVDPGVGLTGVLGVLEVAERLAGRLRVQIAVFPQEGLACRPGTSALVREALRLPGTVVGGCPYVEATPDDARAHVETVLDLAVEHGVPADLHLDLADGVDDPRFLLAEHVARATAERGLQGRVAIGHVTTLAALGRDQRARVLDRLAAAQVAVTLLPATDLHLSGRHDERDVRRGVAPVRDLWAAGVRTALSSNNVRNAFTPTGRADLLDIALLAARVGHVSEQHELDLLVDAVSTVPAALLDVGEPVGLVPGARADLVVLDTTDADAILLDQPARHLVLKAGTVVGGAVVAGTAAAVPAGTTRKAGVPAVTS